MNRWLELFFFVALLVDVSAAFLVENNLQRNQKGSPRFALPTVEQFEKDPFMKQVQYGSELTRELMSFEGRNNDEEGMVRLGELIQAQLSHPDGIRGFMVSYLTADESPADWISVPPILLQALKHQANRNPQDLIPLACMNVVMPVAMTTMHKDPELAASSAKTGERGVRVLDALADIPEAQENAKAILAVATDQDDDTADEKLTKYWTEFFEKWGYQTEQKKSIAGAMTQLLAE